MDDLFSHLQRAREAVVGVALLEITACERKEARAPRHRELRFAGRVDSHDPVDQCAKASGSYEATLEGLERRVDDVPRKGARLKRPFLKNASSNGDDCRPLRAP